MSKQTFLSRFSLIIKRLERGPATYEQLKQHLENESGIQDKNFTISIRTLQRDIKHIYDQFSIEIANERKGDKRYFIREQPDSKEHTQRILEAYDMLNIVKASQEHNKYVLFETRQPKGLDHFQGLLYACSNKKVVEFNHTKYANDMHTSRTVHPLALKEARGRWYLLAIDTKDRRLKSFGLDRMENIRISKTSFRENYAINMADTFAHSFGIINDEAQAPQKIQLLLSHEQGQYLINYPLHQSQRVAEEKKNGDIILELHLKITYDLVMELMSYGDNIKILSPKSLVNEVVKRGRKMVGRY